MLRAILALLLCALCGTALAGPLPAYPPATQPLTGAETMVGQQSGRTVQIGVSQIAASAVSVGYLYTDISTLSIGANKTIAVAGYHKQGDLGANCLYTSVNATSTGPAAEQDATGVWFNLVIAGPVRVGCFGAYGDYNFATFSASIAGNQMIVVGAPYGIILPGQTVTAPGVPANTTILSGPSSGSFGTYTLSKTAAIPVQTTACGTCTYNSTTGQITLTMAGPTGLTVGQPFRLTGIVGTGTDLSSVNNRWVAEAGTTGSTVVFHMANWKIAADGSLSAPNILTITAAILNIQMSSYGGHDDTAALKAAVALGADVDASGGLPPTTPRNNYPNLFFGVTDSIILPLSNQQFSMNNAGLVAIPGWTGTPVPFAFGGSNTTPTMCSQMPNGACYILVANGPNQIVDKAICDGGQPLGVTAGCFFLGNGRNRVIDSFATHSAVAAGCMCGTSGDSFFIGDYFQEWSNQEAEYNYDPNYLGDGILITRADDQIYDTFTRWTKINLHFAAGSQTTLLADLHPYQGRGFPNAPRSSPVNLQTDVGFNGGMLAKNFYADEGTYEFFSSQSVQPNLFWVLQQPKTSTINTPDQTSVHVYADGSNFPFRLDYSFLPQAAYPSDWHLIQYVDNPNLAAIGSVTADGVHVQYTLASGMNWTGTNGGVSELVNTPQPQVNTRVTIASFGTSGYNCARCTVTAVDNVSVTISNSQTGATGALGTAQLNWNTDWTNFNALTGWQGLSVDNKLPIIHTNNKNVSNALPVSATGSITTTTVTFTGNPGTLTVGQSITGVGVTTGTTIAGGITQWNGSSAVATVNISQSVGSEALTLYGVNPDEVYNRATGTQFDRTYTFLPTGAGALPLAASPVGHFSWFTGTQGGALPTPTPPTIQEGIQFGPEGGAVNDTCLIWGVASNLSNDAYFCNPHNGTLVFGRNGTDQIVFGSGTFRPVTSGVVDLGTAGLLFRNEFLSGFARRGVTTVGNLATVDASPVVGDLLSVSDANACTINVAPTGGGAVTCPLVYNGAAWIAQATH